MAIDEANLGLNLFATETIQLNFEMAGQPTVQLRHTTTDSGTTRTLTEDGDVPVTKIFSDQKDLVSSAETLTLTALSRDAINDTISMDGLKLQAMYFKNMSSAGTLKIEAGSTNPYTFGGEITLQPGGEILLFQNGNAPEIDPDGTGSNSEIALSSTGDPTLTYQVILLAG